VVELHRHFPLLAVIDLAPIVLAVAGALIGNLLQRSRKAEAEQRKLATTLAQVWSEGAVAQDADVESLLTNGYRRTAAISHELRTPLTAMAGFADIIEEELEDHPAKRYVGEIRSGCRFMIELINEFLASERSIAGVFAVKPEPVDLDHAVESVVRLLSPVASQRSLTLALDQRSGLVVRADPRRLQQVLTNLIANALNYTPHGGVTVSAIERAGQAVISISDTGVGMTEQETEALFEPFNRGERTEAHGTGLGLSLAKSMMEAMEGTVSAQSEGLGHGTTMTLTLPVESMAILEPV
jgi:signal transduction histidine kinase